MSHIPQSSPEAQQPRQPFIGDQYGPVLAAPKKRKSGPVVLLVVAAMLLLGTGGCMAIVGSVGRSVVDAFQKPDDRDPPQHVIEGTAFILGSQETLAGWKVKKSAGLDGAEFNVIGKVRNTGDATSAAFIHFKFLSTSGEVLGNVDCNSADQEPGQTRMLKCIPDGKFGRYAKITAEATF